METLALTAGDAGAEIIFTATEHKLDVESVFEYVVT